MKTPYCEVIVKRTSTSNDDFSIIIKSRKGGAILNFHEIAILEAIASTGNLFIKMIMAGNENGNPGGAPFSSSTKLSKKHIIERRKKYSHRRVNPLNYQWSKKEIEEIISQERKPISFNKVNSTKVDKIAHGIEKNISNRVGMSEIILRGGPSKPWSVKPVKGKYIQLAKTHQKLLADAIAANKISISGHPVPKSLLKVISERTQEFNKLFSVTKAMQGKPSKERKTASHVRKNP